MPNFDKSYQLYDYNLLLLRRLVDFCGCDTLAENYKFNYRTATCWLAITGAVIFSIYSMFFYYPDIYKMCEAFFPLCTAVQGVPKIYFMYNDRQFYRVQYERLRALHYEYRTREEINAALLLLMERIHLGTKLMSGIYIGGGFVYLLYPIYMYVAHSERIPIFALEIPGVDSESTIGYIVADVVQIIMIVVAITGYAAADSTILLFVASAAAYIHVFVKELDQLDEDLNENIRNEKLIKERVRTICMQHQEIIEYESNLDERYVVICFIQILTSVGGMSAIIFLVYMKQFIPGYGMLMAQVGQFLEICLLGTILTVKNEEITDAIYRSNWYLLDIPERKCFALMLHKSQHFVEMTVGGFAPLNLETFVAIMNKIYSYFMMLINFVE